MPIWPVVLIIVWGILIAIISIAIYCYSKYRGIKNRPTSFSVVWHNNDMKNNKEVETMFPTFSQQPTVLLQ